MILIFLTIPLILNVVISNAVYNLDLLKFMNLANLINQGFILGNISVNEVINFEYSGINEMSFEDSLEDLIRINLNGNQFRVSYFYYNSNQTFCGVNQCDSVQFKIENLGAIVKLNYEFNYQIKRNY